MSGQRWSARIDPSWDDAQWHVAARHALAARVPPDAMDWRTDGEDVLLDSADVLQATPIAPLPRVPRSFLALAGQVACHRDAQRFHLLYRLLWRMTHGGEHDVLGNPADGDVRRLHALAQDVRRASHKMKAFVRFREVPGEHDRFVAWFEPEHRVVDRVAPFFARRFAGMRWAILTPERSAVWDGSALRFAAGATRADAPRDDAGEALWRAYYAHIFNPARLNPTMMRKEMPQRYWKHLPEAALIPELTRGAGARVRDMAERMHVPPRRRIPQPIPATREQAGDAERSLDALRAAARGCRACPLWEPATQTVFGEGPEDARILLLGEQPGDMEDLTGRPFVGPAGCLLDRALSELGLDRGQMYLTNAVKHFRFERRGKFRLHRNPEPSHVQACRTWLAKEIERVRPDVIVCLGATAALAVFGARFRLMEQRGVWQALHDGTHAFATVHPAWVLRQHDEHAERAYRAFVEDLRLLADLAETRATAAD